jgi:hypothetical protein
MAIYVYHNTTGELVSWCPSDTDPVADDATLAANGLAKVSGLPPLGPTVAWDASTRTTVTVTAPTLANVLVTFDFIMAFTAAELAGIRASTDNNVAQFLFAMQVTQGLNLNHSTIKNSLQYLVNHSLLTQARANAILATMSSGAGQ